MTWMDTHLGRRRIELGSIRLTEDDLAVVLPVRCSRFSTHRIAPDYWSVGVALLLCEGPTDTPESKAHDRLLDLTARREGLNRGRDTLLREGLLGVRDWARRGPGWGAKSETERWSRARPGCVGSTSTHAE